MLEETENISVLNQSLCKSCGKSVNLDDLVCNNCGEKLIPAISKPKPSPKTKMKQYLIWGCVLFSLIIGLSIYGAIKSKRDAELKRLEDIEWEKKKEELKEKIFGAIPESKDPEMDKFIREKKEYLNTLLNNRATTKDSVAWLKDFISNYPYPDYPSPSTPFSGEKKSYFFNILDLSWTKDKIDITYESILDYNRHSEAESVFYVNNLSTYNAIREYNSQHPQTLRVNIDERLFDEVQFMLSFFYNNKIWKPGMEIKLSGYGFYPKKDRWGETSWQKTLMLKALYRSATAQKLFESWSKGNSVQLSKVADSWYWHLRDPN